MLNKLVKMLIVLLFISINVNLFSASKRDDLIGVWIQSYQSYKSSFRHISQKRITVVYVFYKTGKLYVMTKNGVLNKYWWKLKGDRLELENWDGEKQDRLATIKIGTHGVVPVQLILKEKIPYSSMTYIRETVFRRHLLPEMFKAVKRNDLSTIAMLGEEYGVSIRVRDKDKNTTLHYAAREGNKESVEYLLEESLSVNSKNAKGQTPLHMAAEKGHTNVVRLLLKHNARVGTPDAQGKTALDLSRQNGHKEVFKVLSKARGLKYDFEEETTKVVKKEVVREKVVKKEVVREKVVKKEVVREKVVKKEVVREKVVKKEVVREKKIIKKEKPIEPKAERDPTITEILSQIEQ